jgi:uncharacterized membrane protein YphA (DoxX/SURF4 family)
MESFIKHVITLQKRWLPSHIGILFIMPMFLFAGLHKLFNYTSTWKAFHSKFIKQFNLPSFVSQYIISYVILLEIISPIVVGYSYLNSSETNATFMRIIAISLLVFFTIIATILYHPPTQDLSHFMKNLAIIGGLILALHQ